MSEDLKTKFWDWFSHLTYKRLLISTIAGLLGITGYTLWENRQKVFEARTIQYDGDYPLAVPSAAGHDFVQRFVNNRPEIVLVTLLDANPVTNTRNVVHRWYGDAQTEATIEATSKANPNIGDGALFTSDAENNKQVLAVLSGEMYCAPVSGIIFNAFPDVAARVKYSCRVPLPPAFGKATGWFAVHLSEWPPRDMDNFKNQALSLSLTYFNTEILKHPVKMP